MRNVASIRNTLDQRQLSAIILSASAGRRMLSYGSKSLIKINDKNLIIHQIESIREKFPQIGEIIVVLGYEADRVYRALPEGVKVVENEKFSENNAMRSLSLGLRVCLNNFVMVIHGDIFFDKTALNFLNYSAVVVDGQQKIRDDKVGLTIDQDKNIVHCDYGLEKKWGQIMFLTGKELSLLRKMTKNRERDSLCLFEGINYIVGHGGKIKACEIDPKTTLFEFDSIGDVDIFNQRYYN